MCQTSLENSTLSTSMNRLSCFVMLAVISASCAREQQPGVAPNASNVMPGTVVNGYRVNVAPDNTISTLRMVSNFKGTPLVNIPRMDARYPFKVTLQTIEGNTISDFSQLQSRTEYKLLITGKPGVQYHIQQYDGFDLLKQDSSSGSYVIRSSSDLGKTMYMNVIPLLSEGSMLKQARPQMVTLVNYE